MRLEKITFLIHTSLTKVKQGSGQYFVYHILKRGCFMTPVGYIRGEMHFQESKNVGKVHLVIIHHVVCFYLFLMYYKPKQKMIEEQKPKQLL